VVAGKHGAQGAVGGGNEAVHAGEFKVCTRSIGANQ
jgi:hypothetical protein